MTRQRALRLAREWAQGHTCSIRYGEVEEYHSMFAVMLEEAPQNEPLTCEGCIYNHNRHDYCDYCVRRSHVSDYYRRPPERQEDNNG